MLVWGAFEEKCLIGAVAARRCLQIDSADTMHLWGLYVEPAHRGAGVGARLLQVALKRVGRRPRTMPVDLHVSQDNTVAIRLFERFGFKIIHDASLSSTRLCAMRLLGNRKQRVASVGDADVAHARS